MINELSVHLHAFTPQPTPYTQPGCGADYRYVPFSNTDRLRCAFELPPLGRDTPLQWVAP